MSVLQLQHCGETLAQWPVLPPHTGALPSTHCLLLTPNPTSRHITTPRGQWRIQTDVGGGYPSASTSGSNGLIFYCVFFSEIEVSFYDFWEEVLRFLWWLEVL